MKGERKKEQKKKKKKKKRKDTPLFRLTCPLAPGMQQRLESLQNQLLCLVGDLEISGSRCSPASLASSRPLSILVYAMLFTSVNTSACVPPSRLLAPSTFRYPMFQISASRPFQIANTIRHKNRKENSSRLFFTSSLTNEPSAPQVQWSPCLSLCQHIGWQLLYIVKCELLEGRKT
jgi:hypothetical protein